MNDSFNTGPFTLTNPVSSISSVSAIPPFTEYEDDVEDTPAPPAVSFWEAFIFWLKLGFITFGGPAGQIAIMHNEVVDKRRWLSEARFLHALNYCMVLPGPEGQQLAIYIGWLMHRHWGGIVAGTLFVLPSLLMIIGLSWGYMIYGNAPVVVGLLYGIKPAVVAIVLYAAYRLGSTVLKNYWLWGIAVSSFIALFVLHIPFPYMIAAAALIGYVSSRYVPHAFSHNDEHNKAPVITAHAPAFLDDNTPPPPHARFSWGRCISILFIGAILWILPVVELYACFGWEHTYTKMALFFTQAALFTFGGAYAVLPYVYQGAVMQYHWVLPSQMLDGLALSESTPGPLIIVVAFVGFVAGYGLTPLPSLALSGPLSPFVSGAIAACVVTWFTFLPSFIFIFVGAPLVESSRDKISFTAPLTAISAVITGGIMNLALFFAYPVLLPNGFKNSLQETILGIDWLAFFITILAGLALFKFKRRVFEVIGGAAILGLIIKILPL